MQDADLMAKIVDKPVEKIHCFLGIFPPSDYKSLAWKGTEGFSQAMLLRNIMYWVSQFLNGKKVGP